MKHQEETLLGNGGIWWESGGHLWAQRGSVALPRTDNKEVARERIRRYEEENVRWCVGCKVEMTPKEVAGRHFAGMYCSPCWELYKERHKNKCSICSQPRYNCCC